MILWKIGWNLVLVCERSCQRTRIHLTQVLSVYSNLRFENLSLILNRKSHTAIGARKRPPGVESRKKYYRILRHLQPSTCCPGASRAIFQQRILWPVCRKKHLTLWHPMVGRCYSFETKIPLVAVVHSWSADIDGWWIHLRCSQESGSGVFFFLWASKIF